MSDGCSAQYKSRQPLTDLSYGILDFGFPSERHFYGSRHGKGPSDGAGAAVKSFVRRGVLGQKAVVNNAQDFFNYAQKLEKDEEHSKRTLFLVDDIDRNRPDRTNTKTLVGTRKIQCAKTVEKNKISTRNLSCFCEPCLKDTDHPCENSAYVEGWVTQDLEGVGRGCGGGRTRGGHGRVRTRGGHGTARTRGGRGRARTRGGHGRLLTRGGHGTARTRGGRGRARITGTCIGGDRF